MSCVFHIRSTAASSSASIGLSDYSQVDMLDSRLKSFSATLDLRTVNWTVSLKWFLSFEQIRTAAGVNLRSEKTFLVGIEPGLTRLVRSN